MKRQYSYLVPHGECYEWESMYVERLDNEVPLTECKGNCMWLTDEK
jgi:hypothetical protein